MCRPGSTEHLQSELAKARINTSDGTFIVGPELEDGSSTEVRTPLVQGDQASLMQMLHPDVARWCWKEGPYRPPADANWVEESAVAEKPEASSQQPAAAGKPEVGQHLTRPESK